MPDNPQRPYKTYAYTLTADDALAWRQLRNDWSTGEKLFGLTAAIALGLFLAVLPETLIGAPFDLRFVAALVAVYLPGYGLFRAVIGLNDRRLARRDIPAPRHVILEDWVDHLDERWEGGRRSVALEMIGPVLDTPGHVFVQGPGTVYIIPAAAFDGPAEKQAFATNLEEMADKWASTLDGSDD